MKKIIRLTESDLVRLVKKVIKEHGGSNLFKSAKDMVYGNPTPSKPQKGPGGLYYAAAAEGFKGKQVRFYEDESNTKPKVVLTINDIIFDTSSSSYGEIDIDTKELNYDMVLYCDEKSVSYEDPITKRPMKLYNKVFFDDLKSTYCTKSTGGSSVGNIGKYSSVDSNKPNNYV